VFFKHQSLAWSRGALAGPLRSFVAETSPASLRERLRCAKPRLRNAKSFAEGDAGEARERSERGGTQCPA
jgi:hypothetical protein